MGARVDQKEIKKAESMADRKRGVTRRQLATVLGITAERAKGVLGHAMAVGRWITERKGGSGRDNRTLIYKRASKRTPKPSARRQRKRGKKK